MNINHIYQTLSNFLSVHSNLSAK